MGDNEDFDNIVEKCGLPLDICTALFEAGWTYVQEENKPQCWIGPIAKLETKS